MITLRKYQQEAINSVFNYFYQGNKGNPLVVAPTGSGKSIIIGGFCKQVMEQWGEQRILVVSHVKEILEQDYEKIKEMCPRVDIGLYSAGLGKKHIGKITVAGIQSIYNKPELFDSFDIIIVDEAHTIPHTREGRYHKFFEQVEVPVIGFTATPFRLGYGYLHLGDGAFFSDIVYTIPIKTLQDQGHLCLLTSKGTENRLDATGVKKQAGDFILKELSAAFDRDLITTNIVSELILYKELRKMWLVFAIDIKHAEHLANELNGEGIKTGVVHSKMEGDRAKVIQDFKDGGYQCLVSVAVLTTGFDAPGVDLIALLRPTTSPVLHIQIIGRGLRVSPEKENCLILDFAGNLMRNGAIDSPVIKTKGKGGGEAIMKECPHCAEIVHAAVRTCPSCLKPFVFKHNLQLQAGQEAVVTQENWFKVDTVDYEWFSGAKGIPMIMVYYQCGIRRFREPVCIEHRGYPRHKAQHWFSRRGGGTLPDKADIALPLCSALNIPSEILVNESGKYPEIKEQKF